MKNNVYHISTQRSQKGQGGNLIIILNLDEIALVISKNFLSISTIYDV